MEKFRCTDHVFIGHQKWTVFRSVSEASSYNCMKTPRPPTAFERHSRPDALFERWNVDARKRELLGGIVVIAAVVEFQTERTIWALEGHEPASGRHWTDSRPISDFIDRLAKLGNADTERARGDLVELWCEAATPAFHCRNSIVHGIPISFGGEWVNFSANYPLGGAVKKRPPTTFSADNNTLNLIQGAFAVLLHTLPHVQQWDEKPPSENGLKQMMSALREARSIGWELKDLAAAVNHEKY
ncbi:MAG: hypothetical protein PSX37_03240 [bacterium]|nr:hypothetical protein [bacterium]